MVSPSAVRSVLSSASVRDAAVVNGSPGAGKVEDEAETSADEQADVEEEAEDTEAAADEAPAGGGTAEARATVVLVENDPVRAKALSERLPRVTIVQGDIADTELLLEESVARMDLVIAATGDDASNVLACAYAAAEGAYTVTVLHKLALLPLVRRFGINAALSPRTASANAGATCRRCSKPCAWKSMKKWPHSPNSSAKPAKCSNPAAASP